MVVRQGQCGCAGTVLERKPWLDRDGAIVANGFDRTACPGLLRQLDFFGIQSDNLRQRELRAMPYTRPDPIAYSRGCSQPVHFTRHHSTPQ